MVVKCVIGLSECRQKVVRGELIDHFRFLQNKLKVVKIPNGCLRIVMLKVCQKVVIRLSLNCYSCS